MACALPLNMKKYKKHLWCAVMMLLIVAFDQITKYLAVLYLKGNAAVTFIPKVVQFTYAENTGMAFSMLRGARWVFIVLTAAVCLFGLWYLFSNRCKSLWAYWSIGVVLSGGFGNLIDRILHNYVVDFIEPTFVNFAVFNIADSAVTLGAISLAAYLLYDAFRHKGEKHG